MSSEEADIGVETKKRRIAKAEKTEVVDARSKIKSSSTASSSIESKSQTKTGSLWSLSQEEDLALQRDPRKDLELHRGVCDQLRSAIEFIHNAKRNGASDTKNLEEMIKHGTLQFVALKKLNRVSHLRNKKIKDATSEAKQNVDEQHLRLQNLLYETMHLKKEVAKCLQFHSTDEDIALVDLNEFYAEAPVEFSQPELTRNDPHQLTLARLNWELEQRRRLSGRLTEVKKHKEEVAVEITSKKGYLGSLKPKLMAIQQATKPVQEYMNVPYDDVREQYRVASALPGVLYVLYVQAIGYRDARDPKLSVTVQGDLEAARRGREASPDTDNDTDNNSDNEEDKEDKDTTVKPSTTTKIKRHHRRSDAANLRSQRRLERLQRVHPLIVTIAIPCCLDNGSQGSGIAKDTITIELKLSYLTTLNIVCVHVKLSGIDAIGASSISGGDLLSSEALLQCLYPNDSGLESPNPSNRFLLASADVKTIGECIPTGVGRPYRWVQEVCGLQFPSINDEFENEANNVTCARGFDEIMERIRRRMSVRLSLAAQLKCLEMGGIAPVNFEGLVSPSVKVVSRLVDWKQSTFEDFATKSHSRGALQLGLVSAEDFYFTARVERGSAKMFVWVVVAMDYPSVAPLIVLGVQWKGEKHAGNDEDLRGMEREVNLHVVEDMKSSTTTVDMEKLLSVQLHRLLMCFDVYLETDGGVVGGVDAPVEIAREKMCPRLYRGRERGRPYLYSHAMKFLQHR